MTREDEAAGRSSADMSTLDTVGARGMEPSSSRRRHARIDALGRCFAQLGGGWEASVLNLSVGGMLLRLTRSLTPGSSYIIKLFLDEQVAMVEARVVRLDPGEDDCLAGMQFTSVSFEDAARLRRYLGY